MFSGSMVNMAGTASSLSTLRASLDAALRIHKPQAIILAVDFWWFSPAWEKDPFEERSLPRRELQYGPDTLKAPWTWLMHRRISLGQFFAPLYGGFREDRFGARAQWDSEGFGPDGSWYPLARLTGDEQGDEPLLTVFPARNTVCASSLPPAVSVLMLWMRSPIFFSV